MPAPKDSPLTPEGYRPNQILAGFLWMCASAIGTGSMAVLAREMALHGSHPFQNAFLRAAVGLVLILPLLRHQRVSLRPTQPRLMFLRAALAAVPLTCTFYASAKIPLAQVSAIAFAAPILVVVLSVLILHERVYLRRWIAVAIGFAGMIAILRPGSAAFELGTLVAAFGACAMAGVTLCVRLLGRTEPAERMVFWATTGQFLFILPLALSVWTWPGGTVILLAIGTGFCGTLGQYGLTRALQSAEASVISPLTYLRLPYVALMAFFLYGEIPDAWTLIGAAVIIASALYITHRERARKGKAAVPVQAPPS